VGEQGQGDLGKSAGRRNDVELVIGYKFIAFEGTFSYRSDCFTV
jgi:hypothetical protein